MVKKSINKKSQIPEGVGLLISEVVEHLQRKGYSVTAQQIRQYEDRDKLFKSIRTLTGNYREYTPILINTIAFICRLEMIRFPKKRMKEFFNLREEIKKCPSVETTQIWDSKIGQPIFVSQIKSGTKKGSAEFIKAEMLINRYIGLCDEIRERFEFAKEIIAVGIADINSKKNTIQRILNQ